MQTHLVQLIKEKQVNELKSQLNVGVRLINGKDKKEFVYHVQTDNLKVLPTDDETIFFFMNYFIILKVNVKKESIILNKKVDLLTMVLKIYLLTIEKLI